jgi:hypothetical protein
MRAIRATAAFFVAAIVLILFAMPRPAANHKDGSPGSRAGIAARAGQIQSSQLPSVTISLGTPQQIFHLHQPDAMGLFNVPDMHAAVLQQSDKSYLLWITGNIGDGQNVAGSVARLATQDFVTYQNAGPGTPASAQPVFTPSCRGDSGMLSCLQNYDAKYVGANTVITASNGKDLLMFYEAGTVTYASDPTSTAGPEFNVIALARSTDGGLTWAREGPVLSGTDAKPNSPAGTSQPGISEPGIVIANGFMYMFYQYVPNEPSEPEAPSVIQAARAPVSGDGAPGTWTKYYKGSFGSQPGLGGLADAVVATGTGSGCTRPVQVWPAFSTYLNAYVLFWLCNEGWFFSTSNDLVTWTAPVQFLNMPMFVDCQPMDLNYILVTPGNQPGEIGQTGYVVYASTPSHGANCPTMVSHELWIRPFTFSRTTDTLALELAKQKASGKLIVYATSTDSMATLSLRAIPVDIVQPPIDLGTMAKTDPNGNEFFLINKRLPAIASIQISSTSGGSLTAPVKGH